MKKPEEVMEILEAYDLTGSLRQAAALVGCDHKTVAYWVRQRELAGGMPAVERKRPAMEMVFAEKVDELVDRSGGRIRADVAHRKLVALGYEGSERTTRRWVAESKRRWRARHGRRTRPWIPEPGLWMQWDYADGPKIAGQRTVLFCAWLAWSRFRVVVALRDKTMPSVVIGLDRALRTFGGSPTYALTEYVPGHIFGLLCPTQLCGRPGHAACDRGDRRGRLLTVGHITLAGLARVLPLLFNREEVVPCWSGISSGRRRSIGSGRAGSARRSSGTLCGWPSTATRRARCCTGCRC